MRAWAEAAYRFALCSLLSIVPEPSDLPATAKEIKHLERRRRPWEEHGERKSHRKQHARRFPRGSRGWGALLASHLSVDACVAGSRDNDVFWYLFRWPESSMTSTRGHVDSLPLASQCVFYGARLFARSMGVWL